MSAAKPMSAAGAVPGARRTLYVSDLDGTLLQPGAELSAYAVASLRQLFDAGMLFTIATARSSASVRTILAPLAMPVPVILMNGAQIYEQASGDYLHVEFIPVSALRELLSLLAEHGVSGFLYGLDGGRQTTYYETLGSETQRAFMDERVRKYDKPFEQVPSFRQILHRGICYVSLSGPHDRLAPLYTALQKQPVLGCSFYQDVNADDHWMLEVHSSRASKGQAVRHLRERLAVDRVVGFGDNLNDLSLFAACDETFAVANAHPDLLRAASGHIASNREDGVVRWLLSRWCPQGESEEKLLF